MEIVFFSKRITTEFPSSWEKIETILRKHKIARGFLNGTKSIWARDYMPLQTAPINFVQFQYNSSYIREEKYADEKTIPEEIPERKQFHPNSSDIILDGGNVIRLKDKILISERVVKDNPDIPVNELTSQLSELLDGTIYLVTDINSDMTGHVDGMARFLDEQRVLVNNRDYEYKYWKKGLEKSLVSKGFQLIDVPFFTYKERKYPLSAIGGYLNYLELDNLIILPVFASNEVRMADDGTNISEMDEYITGLFNQWFPHKIIETIEINDIVRRGGLMNCISWNTHPPVPKYMDQKVIPVYKSGDSVLVIANCNFAEGISIDNCPAIVVDMNRSSYTEPNSGQNFLRFNPMEEIDEDERMAYIKKLNVSIVDEDRDKIYDLIN